MKLKKHLKLDFKEFDTVNPTVQKIGEMRDMDINGKTIFLNADILPGPGNRYKSMEIQGDAFIDACFSAMNGNENDFAFSLGWRVDCRSIFGYTADDINAMSELILSHKLCEKSKGVVLAVNARVLAKNCSALDTILSHIPGTQVLVWTGTGEPPISQRKINLIKNHFDHNGYGDRVGFDCKIANGFFSGLSYDTVVEVVGLFWNLKQKYLYSFAYSNKKLER